MTPRDVFTDSDGNGGRILKWWPVILAALTWVALGFGGFFQLRAEVIQSRTERIGQIQEVKAEITAHERAQTEATAEQNRRLSVIEADIKELLRRKGGA